MSARHGRSRLVKEGDQGIGVSDGPLPTLHIRGQGILEWNDQGRYGSLGVEAQKRRRKVLALGKVHKLEIYFILSITLFFQGEERCDGPR